MISKLHVWIFTCSNKAVYYLLLNVVAVVAVVSVSFDQPSYSVRENNNLELTLVLSGPLGCNCYTSVVVKTDDMEATGEWFTRNTNSDN